MNPVENKQPSDWAMKKAVEMFCTDVKPIEVIAKELDSLKRAFDERNRVIEMQLKDKELLKSQADGLASALDRITTYKWTHQPSILEWGRILAIGQRSLEAYRKGEGK